MTDEELQGLLGLDGAPGPACAIDGARADAIIDAALTGAGFGPGGGGNGSASGAGRASGGRTAGGSTAAGTKLAIVAAAALVLVAVALLAGRSRHPPTQPLVPPPVDAPLGESAGSSTSHPTAAIDAATSQVSPDADPPGMDLPEEDERGSDRPGRATSARGESDPAAAAADLLGEANAKRAAKQWRESAALYARVVRLAPKSLAAQTALVASATLHLEHLADPKGAAQRFRRALAIAPAGPLAEDARWGLAEAARASHDTAGEAAALDDFLAHHGRSPLAQRAKARRAELP